MEKIKSWLFRESLELNKHWWHRLIKVIFISLFSIIAIASYISIIFYPDRAFFSKHNIVIKNTLYQFTENYNGEDSNNTIPTFFKQEGEFGLLVDGSIDYISEYSLGKIEEGTFCVKNPEKYLEGISKVLYSSYLKTLSYEKAQATSLDIFSDVIKKQFNEDKSRKCYFHGISFYDQNLKDVTNLSSAIINFKPSIIFYVEATIIVPILAFISFLFYVLIYYRLILYIVYGNKK
ncbi:MAG: hypothetical protein WC444_02530 [Candidatus Paceibacterota bacterium]